MTSSEFDLERAWGHFYEEYGAAMLAWQILESELATLFSFVTRIPPAMSMQLYYSARSFNGRIDLLKAGVAASKAPDDIKTLSRNIINKARKYSEYRNKFAHDQPLLYQDGHPPKYQIIMVDGKGSFQPDAVKQQYIAAAVSVTDIAHAAKCFRELADLTRSFWAQLSTPPASLDKLRAQLLQLPSLPPSKGQSQPPAGPQPPPKP